MYICIYIYIYTFSRVAGDSCGIIPACGTAARQLHWYGPPAD